MMTAEAIRKRRTSKDYDGREVPDSVLLEALELANLAPNHKINQPWRFRVLRRAGVLALINYLKAGLSMDEQESFAKPLERLSKVGALIYVTCVKDSHDFTDRENYAATAASIQNILLHATSQGLVSYWSTAKIFAHPLAKSFVKLDETEWLVGALWLGYGKNPEAPPRKPASNFTTWI